MLTESDLLLEIAVKENEFKEVAKTTDYICKMMAEKQLAGLYKQYMYLKSNRHGNKTKINPLQPVYQSKLNQTAIITKVADNKRSNKSHQYLPKLWSKIRRLEPA